jgi:transposase
MAKYKEELKREVVGRYLAGRDGLRSLSKEFDVGRSTISAWVSRYRHHGDTGLRKKHEYYESRFKLFVLQRMWQERWSYTQTTAFFNIRGGTSVVSGWERMYHEGGLDALKPKSKGRPKTMTTSKPTAQPTAPTEPASEDARTLKEVLKENEYLRAEVAYLKKLRALIQAKEAAAQKKRG